MLRRSPKRVVAQEFFDRPTLIVARDLLGKFLVACNSSAGSKRGTTAYCITEVEAYDGPKDKASHAYKGRTPRNKIMFGSAGCWYVYYVYGMHWLLNITAGPEGYPAAILIRGTKEVSGPARLTKVLGIDKKYNGKKALRSTGLWIEDRGVKIKSNQIMRLPRVGVDYAKEWKDKLYRFLIENDFKS